MPISSLARLLDWFRPSGRPHQQTLRLKSASLKREVRVEVYRYGRLRKGERYQLLCVNDGQDLARMGVVADLWQDIAKVAGSSPSAIPPFLLVAIYADANRMQEYGTAAQADYLGRGARAHSYESFVLEELLPELIQRYALTEKAAERAFAGFSLGGLSAFDIVWRNPQVFSRVGVFSGALWWRSAPFEEAAPDADRIIHTMVETDALRQGMRFWFQAGTADEKDDRNNNGLIDAIDDTLQLITLLKLKGYTPDDIHYEEVPGGTHDPETWGRVFPTFVSWWLLPER